MTSSEPAPFREAVAAMNAVAVRPEIELGPIRPPQRLAPHSSRRVSALVCVGLFIGLNAAMTAERQTPLRTIATATV